MDTSYRAYSVLETKDMHEDEEFYYIKGLASTPTPDRHNDVVEPGGAKFTTPMPLLWQHNHDKPVGEMTFAKAEKNGIPFEARLPKIKEAGTLKDRVDEAIQSIKYKLVTAVSIGFRPVQDAYEFMENGGIRFKEWDWYELSVVTIPANSEAVITAIKSADKAFLPPQGVEEAQGVDKRTRTGSRPIQLKSRN